MTEENHNNETVGTALATVAITLATSFWGMSYVFTKFALAEIEPMALLMIRVCLSTIILVAISLITKVDLRPLLPHWKKIIGLAISGVLFSQLGFILGLKFTTPSHGALIYTLAPIFIAILSFFFHKERLTPLKVVGIIIAFSGAVALATEKGIDLNNANFLGDLIMLGAVLGWSYYSVFSKGVVKEFGTRRTMTLTFIFSIPLIVPITLVPALNQPWGDVSLTAWSAAMYLIVFATVGSIYLFTFSLRKLSSTTASVFIYLQPVIASVMSVVILKEVLSVNFYISAAMILSGLLLFQWNSLFGKKVVKREIPD